MKYLLISDKTLNVNIYKCTRVHSFHTKQVVVVMNALDLY